MLDGFWGAVIAVGVVVGALAAIGAAIAVVIGSFNKARTEALRQDNEDLRNRVADTEQELSTEKLKRQTEIAKLGKVEAENGRLWEQLTQRADVESVLSELRTHNRKAEEQWELQSHHSETVEELTLRMVRAVENLGGKTA